MHVRETQLLKGVLEGCVLEMISQEEIYGYELVQKLRQSGFENMVGGTIYPLLQKLEKKGYIKSYIKPSLDGPDRKYFTITRDGEIYLIAFWQEWSSLVEKVGQFQKRST